MYILNDFVFQEKLSKNENDNPWHQDILWSMLADASICTYHAHFVEKTALVFTVIVTSNAGLS